MLTFLELAHATHATLIHAHALHAMPMLTFLELAHATHATLIRAHATHVVLFGFIMLRFSGETPREFWFADDFFE